MFASILLEFHLPNSATWFYFSFMLAIAFFFQFSRLFSLRNFDLLGLYLFVPGFLFIQQSNQFNLSESDTANPVRILGYAWLLFASGLWLVRCFLDLASFRRPTLRSNLAVPGLVWFALALFACLSAVAVRQPATAFETIGRQPAAISGVREGAAAVVSKGEAISEEQLSQTRIWTVRVLSMIGHATVVLGLFFVGWRHFRDVELGVGMATLYLVLPYTAFHIAQLHHVLPAALLVWAIFAYRYVRVSGWLLGLASGTTFFPVLLFPVWMHFYWRRGSMRFAMAYLLGLSVSLCLTLSILWAAGSLQQGLLQTMHLADWQPWRRPAAESIWQGVHWAYRLPVFIVYAVFVFLSFFWPSVRTVSQVTAMSAAILIGIQFWFADRGGLYVLWYTPLLLMLVFRPSTLVLEPPTPNSEGGWATRLAVGMWQRVWRKPNHPQPPALAA